MAMNHLHWMAPGDGLDVVARRGFLVEVGA
jgi:hypothetical protein